MVEAHFAREKNSEEVRDGVKKQHGVGKKMLSQDRMYSDGNGKMLTLRALLIQKAKNKARDRRRPTRFHALGVCPAGRRRPQWHAQSVPSHRHGQLRYDVPCSVAL